MTGSRVSIRLGVVEICCLGESHLTSAFVLGCTYGLGQIGPWRTQAVERLCPCVATLALELRSNSGCRITKRGNNEHQSCFTHSVRGQPCTYIASPDQAR